MADMFRAGNGLETAGLSSKRLPFFDKKRGGSKI
jgi:hypothetical protein